MKKLAIIGCGSIGEYHLDHFLQFRDISIAAFCDPILERAEKFVKKAGQGKAYSEYAKMYDEIKPDMAFIFVPPTCHGEIEFETIKRKIPFFVEKPVTLDLDLAREIGNQVKKHKIIAASGFQCRYDNINDIAKKYIQNNKILTVQASRVGGIPEAPWVRNKATSGGQLVEQAIHQMDMLRYLLDAEPETVYSVAKRGYISQKECPGYFTDDLSTTLIIFKNGITATMLAGCYAKNSVCWESKMTFGARDSRMDFVLGGKVTIYTEGAKNKNEKVHTETFTSDDNYGLICDRTFVEAVISGNSSKIRSLYSDAVKSLAFTLACNRSMETGNPVQIGDL